jgi:hypothetical protein
VSTKKQKDEGTSLEVQEHAGREFAAKIGGPFRVYKEAKSAKSTEARDEWMRLQSDIVAGDVDALWVYDSSRLARNADDSNIIRGIMITRHVRFYPNGVLVDLEDPTGWFGDGVQGLTHEYFRKLLVKKTREGIAQSISTGKHAARRLIGYALSTEKGERMRTVIPEQVKLVRRIFDLFNRGMSLRKLTDTINSQGYRTVEGNLFTRTTVRRILENPRFTGRQPNRPGWWRGDRQGELIASMAYPKIIEPGVWDEAQRNLTHGTARGFSAKAAHISTSLLKCASCGARFHYHPTFSHGRTAPVYLHQRTGKDCGQRPLMVMASYADSLFSIIYLLSVRDTRAVSKLLSRESAQISRQREQIERDAQRIDARIADITAQKKRLVTAIAHGSIAEGDAAEEILKVNAEIEKLEWGKEESRQALSLKTERTELLLREFGSQNFMKFTNEATTDRERRDMLRRIVEKATIAGREITVRIISGKEFRFDYVPRDQRSGVVYLAKQAGVETAVLEEDTLAALLAEVMERGVTEAAVVGTMVQSGKLGGER